MARRTGRAALLGSPVLVAIPLAVALGVATAGPGLAVEPPGAAIAGSADNLVQYHAGPGQKNDVRVTLTYTGNGFSTFHWRIDDVVPISVTGRCVHPDDTDLTVVVCDADESTAEGPFLELWLGDADDELVTAGGGTVHGGLGADDLTATTRRALLHGAAGNDVIHGGAENDIIDGDSGNDVLFGGVGQDIMTGGTGNDVLWGNSNNDQLYGNSGNDELRGGPGSDRLSGGPGRDRLYQ